MLSLIHYCLAIFIKYAINNIYCRHYLRHIIIITLLFSLHYYDITRALPFCHMVIVVITYFTTPAYTYCFTLRLRRHIAAAHSLRHCCCFTLSLPRLFAGYDEPLLHATHTPCFHIIIVAIIITAKALLCHILCRHHTLIIGFSLCHMAILRHYVYYYLLVTYAHFASFIREKSATLFIYTRHCEYYCCFGFIVSMQPPPRHFHYIYFLTHITLLFHCHYYWRADTSLYHIFVTPLFGAATTPAILPRSRL